MGHKNDRTRRARYVLDDAPPPGIKPGLIPIILNDAVHSRDFGFPAALPMVRPGAAEPGNDENIGIGAAHLEALMV
jgi:hypothetical protein